MESSTMNCRTPLVSNTFGTNVVSTFAYTYDALSRRTQRIDSGAITNVFAYNPRSELTTALMGTNTYSYTYDPIGNRQLASANEVTNLYMANELNQYTNINAGAVEPVYDVDGNMTQFSSWQFTWDAENRLISVSSNGVSVVQNQYDYMSRRIMKSTATQTNTFLYDSWNLIQERVEFDGAVSTNQYVWGLDLSGSLQGAGGVGGLLTILSPDSCLLTPAYDANGNVTDLVDTNGAVVAHYEYDPYGNTIAQSGDQADANPFRFSTKYWDGETGFYYYGYRFYSPQLGRWLSKDPLIENAYERYIRLFSPEVANFMLRLLLTGSDESNTYSAFGNDAVGAVDHLGWASRRGGGGGPWHPPDGVHMKCDKGDTCAEIEAKMTLLAKAISSHTGWECLAPERHRNPGHWEEIDNLWTAYADCSTLWYMKNCPGSPPLVPAVAPKKCEKVNLCIDGSCQTTVVAVGATAVACAIGYGVYKVLKTCVTTGVGAVLGGPPGAVGGFCLGLSPVGG